MMGRKRNRKEDNRLPPYVYRSKGRYVWQERRDGKFFKEHRLCSLDAPLSDVWAAYEARTGKSSNTLRSLAEEYQKSVRFRDLAARTKADYLRYHETIMNTPTTAGKFGDVAYTAVTSGVIRKYMDKRGLSAKTQANREKAYLSAVFSWAKERDMVPANPCHGVKIFKVEAERNYVDHEWFEGVYELALKHAPWYVPVAMIIAVACRGRKVEILTMLRADATNKEGVYMRRRKGSDNNTIRRSPALQQAIDIALSRPCRTESLYLLHDYDGHPIKESTFNTAWQRFMVDRVLPAGFERFKFHDLKRKGVSDDEGNWMDGSGHLSQSMARIYRVKPKVVDATW